MKFLAAGVLGAVLGASLLGLAGCARGGGSDDSTTAPAAGDYSTVSVPIPGQGSVLCVVSTYNYNALSCDFSTRAR